jgi:hypothetical protein
MDASSARVLQACNLNVFAFRSQLARGCSHLKLPEAATYLDSDPVLFLFWLIDSETEVHRVLYDFHLRRGVLIRF